MGKACLAAVKIVTIPRLEFTAAAVSVRIGELLKRELDNIFDLKYHTDSTTVLHYIFVTQTQINGDTLKQMTTLLTMLREEQVANNYFNDNNGLKVQNFFGNQNKNGHSNKSIWVRLATMILKLSNKLKVM